MPATIPGTISGESSKALSASRPGKRPRTSAKLAGMPSARPASIENAPIWIEAMKPLRKAAFAQALPNHASV